MIARRFPRAGTSSESAPCPARLLAPRGFGRQRFLRGIKALRPSWFIPIQLVQDPTAILTAYDLDPEMVSEGMRQE